MSIMTVNQLISELQKFQQDLVVVVTDPDCCGCAFGPVSGIEKSPVEFKTKNGDKKAGYVLFIRGDRLVAYE